MKVRFTRPALSDLQAIRSYLAQNDPLAAVRIVDRIIDRAEGLGAHPHTGRQSDLPGIRVASLPRYRYLIFYSVTKREVRILHIRHTSRRPWTAGER